MNAVSSRSHTLLMITVQQKAADGSARVGRLNFAGALSSQCLRTHRSVCLADCSHVASACIAISGRCVVQLLLKVLVSSDYSLLCPLFCSTFLY